MTTVVTIAACCGDTKEVRVTITGESPEDFTIANGEQVERYAYNDRVITVQEVAKVDHRALEIEAAEFSLRQAKLRLEDAASRGFHMGNREGLMADVVAKQAELDALRQPAVGLAPAPEPMGSVHFTAHALAADSAVEAATEPKTYSDGSTATGPAPLPDHSPAEQELSDGAKRVLDSFDEAPYANFGGH